MGWLHGSRGCVRGRCATMTPEQLAAVNAMADKAIEAWKAAGSPATHNWRQDRFGGWHCPVCETPAASCINN